MASASCLMTAPWVPVFSQGFSLRDLNMGKGLGSWLPPRRSRKDSAEWERAGVPFH